ncbi:MAG: glycerol-3-phosphate 1-O-acyltransferase PlsY [Candidatus Margulisbacteria bacterium]|nr:glycerol-3-phosphate 1-O-acyltransferase PlsY [Candidatus Margulisiibacteriota bacterium]
MSNLLAILSSYLIGSIPFSHLFAKLKGKNIQQEGTKNVGATNALVVAGPLVGALAWVGDVGKGFIVVFLALRFGLSPWVVTFMALASIVGHDFSIFLKFKGGKGVATTGGALIAFDPVFGILVFVFWILTILVTRYFIPSTIIVLAGLPVAMLVLGMRSEVIVFGLGAFLLAVYTHRHDLKRLLSGQELRTDAAINKYMDR